MSPPHSPAADLASAYWSRSAGSKSSAAGAVDSTIPPALPPGSATRPIRYRLHRSRACVDATPKPSVTVTTNHFKSKEAGNPRHLHKRGSRPPMPPIEPKRLEPDSHGRERAETGRATCRARGGQNVYISVVAE